MKFNNRDDTNYGHIIISNVGCNNINNPNFNPNYEACRKSSIL